MWPAPVAARRGSASTTPASSVCWPEQVLFPAATFVCTPVAVNTSRQRTLHELDVPRLRQLPDALFVDFKPMMIKPPSAVDSRPEIRSR